MIERNEIYKYACCDAHGYFGDRTKIDSRHTSLIEAVKKARADKYKDERGYIRYPTVVLYSEDGFDQGDSMDSDMYYSYWDVETGHFIEKSWHYEGEEWSTKKDLDF